MIRSLNPLAATLLVVGIAFGFTAQAAMPTSSAPSRQERVDDGSASATPMLTLHRPRPCYSHRCAV